MPKILFVCHKHPFLGNNNKPRGAEISMQIIMQYLRDQGYQVNAFVRGSAETETIKGMTFFQGDYRTLETKVKKADIVLTWGQIAHDTACACIDNHVPYILMVRWFRNIQPVGPGKGPGDMMNRKINTNFTDAYRIIFEGASSIITNNYYSKDVIHRYYGDHLPVLVSYVPVPGKAKRLGKKTGYFTLITPDKELGEFEFVAAISGKLPGNEIWIVNCHSEDLKRKYSTLRNVRLSSYVNNMEDVWKNTSILLCPIYENDICGTLRVPIEAMQHGIPTIANSRAGTWEKIPYLVSRGANTDEWLKKIRYIQDNYLQCQKECIARFKEYDTPGQLAIFKEQIEAALAKKKQAV